jgi:hypothetical protein
MTAGAFSVNAGAPFLRKLPSGCRSEAERRSLCWISRIACSSRVSSGASTGTIMSTLAARLRFLRSLDPIKKSLRLKGRYLFILLLEPGDCYM